MRYGWDYEFVKQHSISEYIKIMEGNIMTTGTGTYIKCSQHSDSYPYVTTQWLWFELLATILIIAFIIGFWVVVTRFLQQQLSDEVNCNNAVTNRLNSNKQVKVCLMILSMMVFSILQQFEPPPKTHPNAFTTYWIVNGKTNMIESQFDDIRYNLTQLTQIGILTNDLGPLVEDYYVHLGFEFDNQIFIAQANPTYMNVLRQVNRLNGVSINWGEVLFASMCIHDDYFLLWLNNSGVQRYFR